MKKLSITYLLITAALLLTVVLLSAAPTGFGVSKYVIGSGGGDSSSSTYAISGTMGQSVTAVSSSPTYSIASGYWTGSSSSSYTVYLPTVLK